MALQAGKVGVYPQDLDKEGHIKQQTPVDPYVLPVASPTTLGGVKPVAKTEAMTQDVGVDENGGLHVAPPQVAGTKIYKKMFSASNNTQINTWHVDNVSINGYTPIGVALYDVYNGYSGYGATLYFNRAGNGDCAVIANMTGDVTNWKAIVYYVKNEDIVNL